MEKDIHSLVSSDLVKDATGGGLCCHFPCRHHCSLKLRIYFNGYVPDILLRWDLKATKQGPYLDEGL